MNGSNDVGNLLSPNVVRGGRAMTGNKDGRGRKKGAKRKHLGKGVMGTYGERISGTKGGKEAGAGIKGSTARLPGFQA